MKTAIFGVGMMGEALLGGLVKAGWDPATIRAIDAQPGRTEQIAEKYALPLASPVEAVQGASAVIIVVKPNNVVELLEELGPMLDPGCLVISLAVGLSTATLEAPLPAGHPVVRAMPNTACMVGEGMTLLSAGAAATPDHLALAERIMAAVGRVKVIPEKSMDAAGAISGCGPAYVMYVAESLIDAGVLLGLPRATATELARQTMFGCGKLLASSDEHPTRLKEMVVSPGGTTAAALRALEDRAVKAAFVDAVEAAALRSAELGQA